MRIRRGSVIPRRHGFAPGVAFIDVRRSKPTVPTTAPDASVLEAFDSSLEEPMAFYPRPGSQDLT